MALRRLRFSNWNFLRMGLKFAPYAWEAWVSPWKSSDNLDAGGNLFPLFLWFSDWHWAVALNIMWFFFTLRYTLHSENSRSRRNSTKCPEAFPGSQFFFSLQMFLELSTQKTIFISELPPGVFSRLLESCYFPVKSRPVRRYWSLSSLHSLDGLSRSVNWKVFLF